MLLFVYMMVTIIREIMGFLLKHQYQLIYQKKKFISICINCCERGFYLHGQLVELAANFTSCPFQPDCAVIKEDSKTVALSIFNSVMM